MKREDLIRNRDYWIFQIQNGLYNIIEKYRKEKNFTKTQLANEFGFHKSYITQILNGDFDHKISKFVDLSLASGKAPIITFVDIDEFVKADSQNKTYSVSTQTRQPIIVNFNDLKEAEKAEYLPYHPERCIPSYPIEFS